MIEDCEDHSEDLVVADTSRHGWLTVHQLRGREQLSSSVQRKVEKIDSRLDKLKLSRHDEKGRFSSGRKNPQQVEFQDRVQTYRRKQGPEEVLKSFANRRREGTCTHCNEPGHFFRECPGLWSWDPNDFLRYRQINMFESANCAINNFKTKMKVRAHKGEQRSGPCLRVGSRVGLSLV